MTEFHLKHLIYSSSLEKKNKFPVKFLFIYIHKTGFTIKQTETLSQKQVCPAAEFRWAFTPSETREQTVLWMQPVSFTSLKSRQTEINYVFCLNWRQKESVSLYVLWHCNFCAETLGLKTDLLHIYWEMTCFSHESMQKRWFQTKRNSFLPLLLIIGIRNDYIRQCMGMCYCCCTFRKYMHLAKK